MQMAPYEDRNAPLGSHTAPGMPTSTIDIESSFTIRAHDLRARAVPRRRYGGPEASFSSAAGLYRTPWLARLRRALRDELLVLHYQPIVSLREGRIRGECATYYEALVRLLDERHEKLLQPAEFLPAAERYGLIVDIDRAVLTNALGLLADGSCGSRTRIAVNLSARSVTEPGMLHYLQRQLAHHRVEAERLVVEITETCAISDMALARAFCEGVRRLGGAIALDDFGAGFGSFQYLRQLPFQYLKIDGELIRGLARSHNDRLLVHALVGLARGMGKLTVAEYADSEITLALLRELGVDYAQGFALGRPASPQETFALAL